VLLFRREVYFHISQFRGVIPACQRSLASSGEFRVEETQWAVGFPWLCPPSPVWLSKTPSELKTRKSRLHADPLC
jgi:hypothetical protein